MRVVDEMRSLHPSWLAENKKCPRSKRKKMGKRTGLHPIRSASIGRNVRLTRRRFQVVPVVHMAAKGAESPLQFPTVVVCLASWRSLLELTSWSGWVQIRDQLTFRSVTPDFSKRQPYHQRGVDFCLFSKCGALLVLFFLDGLAAIPWIDMLNADRVFFLRWNQLAHLTRADFQAFLGTRERVVTQNWFWIVLRRFKCTFLFVLRGGFQKSSKLSWIAPR